MNFLRTQLPLLFLSLVIAFILWLSLSGKDMTTKVLPVTLAYLNANSERLYVDHENLIRAVNLTVEANAAQFRIIESRKLTLNIDLSTLTPGENTFHIDPTTMLDPPLPRGIQNAQSEPQIITLSAYSYVIKQLPVEPTVVGVLPDYLQQTDPIQIIPPTARVRAPEHRAEDLTLVTTTPVVNLGDIRNNENKITLTPNLQGLSIWLEMEPVSFTAHVPVKYIIVEETFTIPVQEVATNVIGPPLPISFSPKTVKVTVSWQKNLPEANLPTADDISVSFTPIASEIKHNESTYLDLKCVVPQGVTVVSIVPPQVKINWLTSRNYRSLSN